MLLWLIHFVAFCSLEIQMREQQQRDHLQSISIAHERSKSQLEAEREVLRLFEKGLKEREAFNGSEKMKLDHLKQMVLKYFLYLIPLNLCHKI